MCALYVVYVVSVTYFVFTYSCMYACQMSDFLVIGQAILNMGLGLRLEELGCWTHEKLGNKA